MKDLGARFRKLQAHVPPAGNGREGNITISTCLPHTCLSRQMQGSVSFLFTLHLVVGVRHDNRFVFVCALTSRACWALRYESHHALPASCGVALYCETGTAPNRDARQPRIHGCRLGKTQFPPRKTLPLILLRALGRLHSKLAFSSVVLDDDLGGGI